MSSLNDYKLSCELVGHSMDVRSVCAAGLIEGVGQVIATGSRDKSTKLWRPFGKEYLESVTLQDHKNFVSCVFYHETEHWLCTGSNDATVCIYLENGGLLPILILKGHLSTVCSIASGVKERSLITGSWDTTARIWTIDETGSFSFVQLKGHEAAVWAVASMPKSKKFVTGSADKNIFYWNDKGEKLRVLKGHTDCVRGIVSLKNDCIVSCSNDATIRFWNADGECVQQMSGHTNYIYGVAQNKTISDMCIVTCGEDSTVRMWNLNDGREMGLPLLLPVQSIWSVACLKNGDIVTGCSDGIARVFTKDPLKFADDKLLGAYEKAIESRKIQISEELGGIKKTDLPGPEVLLTQGNREGQTKMVRHTDGSIKCYNWSLGKWNLVGDVTGASGGTQNTSGKILHEGKEYDYVFNVDISDSEPALKLPYNRGEDPWHSAQAFIHRHNLPQAYLDQVANFIIKNSSSNAASATSSSYQDPFTGGNRYVPGSANNELPSYGNSDPFTGASSYNTASNHQHSKMPKDGEKHFPLSTYLTFDAYDPTKVLDKLREFNQKLPATVERVTESVLRSLLKLAEYPANTDPTAIEGLKLMLSWPSELLFPVLDICRLALRTESIFIILKSLDFMDLILPHLSTSASNQLMIVRCFANMMNHMAGRQEIDALLPTLVNHINGIKTGSNNLQIAIATFYLNVTTTQTLGIANGDKCRVVAEGVIELLKWALDLEACYRSMQAIGNLTTTPFGQETLALVVSVDYVMDKIRELTNTPQTGTFVKVNSIGSALLAAF
uniref:Phospholipase A-2-activating protein n=1 Tax=Glossina brevipalpis TaxID=37001 RepID=A0A1A9WEX5_9MUSC